MQPETYEQLLSDVLAAGTAKGDRTGTGTSSVFGRQLRFDLSEGFPLITTKRVHFKSVALELLWFLRGDSNATWLQDQGVKIWDQWAGPDGDLGPIYGHSWRSIYAMSNKMIEVPVRSDLDAEFFDNFESELRDPIECSLNSEEMWAIEDLGAGNRNRRYKVQLKSGFITEISLPNWKNLTSPENIDGYARSISGVGYLGHSRGSVPVRHYNIWRNMLARCYDPSHPCYPLYGGRGITVSPIWHSLANFSATLGRVPGYYKWVRGEKLDLDKDYFGSGVYSPSTCLFLPREVNANLDREGKVIEIQGVLYNSYSDWHEQGKKGSWYAKTRWDAGKPYRGIRPDEVKVVQPRDGHLWRPEAYIDQISQVMESLRGNPDSRRHIVSAWNVAEIENMALPPCHAFFQFYVADGKLSCQLYQRSADMFLGVPFNIASYALLTMMMAQQLGLEPGEFVWTGGDVHIYDNHVDQVTEQLTREPFAFPTLSFARKPESIFDYRYEDFIVNDYQHHPAIKAPVAV